MRIKFRLHNSHLNFEVPESNVLYCPELGNVAPVADERLEFRRGLLNPIGTCYLHQMVKSTSKVVIVVDDLTRPTPQERLLPVLLDYLNSIGVGDANIHVIIALGTHRFMTQDEILYRFGKGVLDRVPVLNHNFRDPTEHISLGTTQLGTPVEVNRQVYEADLRIVLGTVMPHPLAGWGGGAKLIQPGVCSEKTTEGTHVIGGTYPDLLSLPGNPDNPIRAEIESVVGKIGPLSAINTVLNKDGRIVKILTGDYVRSHREAVKVAEEIFRPDIADTADVVICNAYPCDQDFWQGFKPFFYSHLGVREGGTIIFVISAPEGISGNAPRHAPTLRSWATREIEDTLRGMSQGVIEDKIGASTCVAHRRLLDRANVICTSEGMSQEEIKLLGFKPARSIADALQMAFVSHGSGVSVGILPYGGETLVKLPRRT